jgi:hypothetical protein
MNDDTSIPTRLTHVPLRIRVEPAALDTNVFLSGAAAPHGCNRSLLEWSDQVFRSLDSRGRHRASTAKSIRRSASSIGARPALDVTEVCASAHRPLGSARALLELPEGAPGAKRMLCMSPPSARRGPTECSARAHRVRAASDRIAPGEHCQRRAGAKRGLGGGTPRAPVQCLDRYRGAILGLWGTMAESPLEVISGGERQDNGPITGRVRSP